MYNSILKKYYIIKIYTLALPKKKNSNSACFFLCKYLIKKTPYGNIMSFITQLKKILNIFLCNYKKRNVLFICSDKIFSLNLSQNLSFKQFNFLTKKNCNSTVAKLNMLKKNTFIILYSISGTSKLLSFIKMYRLLSIGFINFHDQPNLADYCLLLESRFFSNIFLFHFFFKKIL